MLSLIRQRFLSVSTERAMKAKKIILNQKFAGYPTPANFKIVDESLPALKDGEFLAEAEFLSVDPFQRVYSINVGTIITGDQVAKILESKNPKFPVGQYVVGEFGWRTHTVGAETPGSYFKFPPRLIKGLGGNLPRSLALGVLGMPGNAALFGFLTICKPKEGDVVVVTAAAGGIGSLVVQIAKMQGCTVVAITGSDAKAQRLINELGLDVVLNYKSGDFEQKLVEATPDQVDCYFDNVGGEISSSVLKRMKKFGRVAVCGSISVYNDTTQSVAREVQTPAKIKDLIIEGFNVTRWRDEWEDGISQNMQLIREGKLRYFETITKGFPNTPQAFIGMLRGQNFGKAIVKV